MKVTFKVPNSLSYKGNAKNWHKFKQQFDIYMKVTGLENTKSEDKVNIFLNIAGEEALEIYNNLKLNPDEKKNFQLVMDGFESYCVTKQNVIYKSFKFFTRVQQQGEFFNDFYNDLQVMANFCNFGDQRERLIRDRIIVGIRNPELQQTFLKAPDLSLEEVFNKCREDEVEKINSGQMKSEIIGNNESENDDEVNIEDGESNNNFEDLLNEGNLEEFTLLRLHVPNEILLNDIAAEEGENYVEKQNGIEDEEINSNEEQINENQEETNTEEVGSNIEVEEEQDEEDVKPLNYLRSNRKNRKVDTKENISEAPDSIREEKILERRKKKEAIQIKIAEIKKKLNNVIKKEVDSEQMGVRQKITRSRVRQIEVKMEPQEEVTSEEETLTEQEETFTEHEETLTEHEEIFMEHDEADDSVYEEEVVAEDLQTMTNVPFQEYENSSETESVEENAENVNSIEAVDEMAEVEYLIEQEAQDLKPTRGRKRQMGTKRDEVKIIKVKRDNLPTLILKSVKKKTLLIGKMPYPCKKCDSSFWTPLQLERHQLVHVLKKVTPTNNATPKKVFKCEECGKEFIKICDLERHTRVHTGEKPSVCNICNKRFQQPYNLNKHLLIHTQEKKFECVICQKKFGRNDVLNRHVLTHSIDKPYRCLICSKTFIRSTQLKYHVRKQHGSKQEPTTADQEAVDDPVPGKSSD